MKINSSSFFISVTLFLGFVFENNIFCILFSLSFLLLFYYLTFFPFSNTCLILFLSFSSLSFIFTFLLYCTFCSTIFHIHHVFLQFLFPCFSFFTVLSFFYFHLSSHFFSSLSSFGVLFLSAVSNSDSGLNR